ncbi:efflux RND transporter periplasmic adaptor subunit [Algoriphagus sanaruensis]|nr:efflux RND transporter periplasmic adaptor subunit [Algoriphagus sanaruensis]
MKNIFALFVETHPAQSMNRFDFKFNSSFKFSLFLFIVVLSGCSPSEDTPIFPEKKSISESVYASGVIKAKDQYEAYALANGPIQEFFVKEGDTVRVGTPILKIFNESEKLRRENAELAQKYADQQSNQTRLKDLELNIKLAKDKLTNDSLIWAKTQSLWNQGIGTEIELEQKKLAFQSSKTSYESSLLKYQDLQREITFNSQSASKNLRISEILENEYILRSKIDGIVYSLPKEIGEMVSPQVTLAVIGSTSDFYLELQIDEYDISKVKQGQRVMVIMDSFKDQTFEAEVTRIIPIMDSKSKTFTVEAEFTQAPERLFPNLTLEANILTNKRESTLVIPRKYVFRDSLVIAESGDTLRVKTGIKNYEFTEILEGLTEETGLILPKR